MEKRPKKDRTTWLLAHYSPLFRYVSSFLSLRTLRLFKSPSITLYIMRQRNSGFALHNSYRYSWNITNRSSKTDTSFTVTESVFALRGLVVFWLGCMAV